MLVASSARPIGKSRSLTSGRGSAARVGPAHEPRAPREQRLDPRARQPVAQAQRVEAHDALDAPRARRELPTHGVAQADAEQLHLGEVPREQVAQLGREVFVHVIRVHAVRETAVGRRDQRGAALGEQRADPAQVGRRVAQVLDHLEADHAVERVRAQRQAIDVREAEVRAALAVARIRGDAIDAEHARARAREQPPRPSRCRSPRSSTSAPAACSAAKR
jgi:hypothetical protein